MLMPTVFSDRSMVPEVVTGEPVTVMSEDDTPTLVTVPADPAEIQLVTLPSVERTFPALEV